jgi:DHA1 family bicyclomycin/chloramphenicol resistance-like MFS transporter
MVGDLFDPAETGRRQATLMAVVLISPAVAPVVGGFIAGAVGWRAIFLLLGGAGLSALAVMARHLPESLRRTEGSPPRDLARDYGRLLRNAAFLRTAAAIAAASSALYMFLSAAPFLLITQWHLSPQQAGVCFLAVAGSSIVGTRLVGRLERRGTAFRQGLAAVTIGAAMMLAAGVAGWAGPPALIGPMMVLGLGAGIAAPSGLASVIRAEEGLAGTAASLAGALQMLGAGLAASALGLAGDPSFLLLGVGATAISAVALLIAPVPRTELCC